MAERDYIGRLLQILRIKSPSDAVSGDDIISVETKLQYSALFPITEDGDVIYKAYADNYLGTVVKKADTSDSNGQVDLSSETDIQAYPSLTAYPTAGGLNTAATGPGTPARYNPETGLVDGLDPSTIYMLVFIG